MDSIDFLPSGDLKMMWGRQTVQQSAQPLHATVLGGIARNDVDLIMHAEL